MSRSSEAEIVRRWPGAIACAALLAIAAALLGACGNSVANTVGAKSDMTRSSGAERAAKAGASTDAAGVGITAVRLKRINNESCKKAPVTFGQPFVKGDVPRGKAVEAHVDGRTLPAQVNVKARNRDGSARHAVITLRAPCESGQQVELISTAEDTGHKPSDDGLALSDVLQTQFDTRISLEIDGNPWHLNARDLLQKVADEGGCNSAGIFCKQWLHGPLATEWVVGAPLEDAGGRAHPHLAAYFAVRAFGPGPIKRVRVDVVVENDWAYVDNPRNYDYRPKIQVAGRIEPAYHPKRFTHYRQARWHRVVWWGASSEAPLYARLDPTYLQSSAAVPRYAHGKLSKKLLHQRQSCAPMQSCGQTKKMADPGAQSAIGPLPRWSAAFVINTDYRIYRWMIANSDALGAYNFHYRQKDTGEPLSVREHPCATRVEPAEMKRCKVPPHADDRFPRCVDDGKCKTPLRPNIAHHPAPAYTAYIATGDWFYASEMTFMTQWVLFWQNPAYSHYTEALVYPTQVRGQAWSLRTLGDAAYILPEDATFKKYFNHILANNIRSYTERYVNDPNANKLGLVRGLVPYTIHGHPWTGTATWQQSFFDWAVGNLADQRHPGADALRNWFSRFPVGLMTAPGYCWENASSYKIRVVESRKGHDYYDSFAEVYRKTFPEYSEIGCDPKKLNDAIRKKYGTKKFPYPPKTMTGWPSSPTGFPANFQIGVAAAYNSTLPNAHKAWNIFATRNTQPDYTESPQFAVVPTLK